MSDTLLETALQVLRDIRDKKPPRPEAVEILRTAVPDSTACLEDIAREVIHRELREAESEECLNATS